MKSIFIAATGQNVGKTTTCLGLVAALKKKYGSVGFQKPVGQEHVETEEGLRADKDVVLFRRYFGLEDAYSEMSPVLFPRGFTRDYLDGKINHGDLSEKILSSFQAINKRRAVTVVEGTGHMGVGSIVDLNNAEVAALLKCPVLLVASGGLGSSFDELALNLALCEKHGAKVAGVILNRVLEDKREMILEYVPKALKKWNVPLIGAIPYNAFLSMPTMNDFAQLFETEILSGNHHKLRHFEQIKLATSSFEIDSSHQLIVVPAAREDVVFATLTRFWDLKIAHPEEELQTGLILTGKQPPKERLIEQIRKAEIPMIYTPVSSFSAMKMINTHTAKIRFEDTVKIEEAIKVVESHIDFAALEKALQR